MNDLDTLRPEVREAFLYLDHFENCPSGWTTIRAELLRLADENAQLRDVLADRDMDREMAAHANKELAALKARIAEAPIGTVILDERETQIISCDLPEGTRVALVKVEE